jgi:hypothetical protein
VTPNDAGDGDDGANGLQNFPVVQTAAVTTGSYTTVSGTLNSLPNAKFTLEFFASPQCDPSVFGEGAVFLGTQEVGTDSSGNAVFQGKVDPTFVGFSVTATPTQL